MASDLKSTTGCVADTEMRISQAEERDVIVTETLTYLLQQQTKLSDRVDYLENKPHLLNIIIYQVKEGSDREDTVGFLKTLIADKLGIPGEDITIVQAHRSLANRPVTEGATPRSIIVRFLQWDMKQKVLKSAWTKKTITHRGSRIFFDHDFSAKLQQEKSLYVPIRKQLKEKQVRSHVIYPSKLKVFSLGACQGACSCVCKHIIFCFCVFFLFCYELVNR